MAKVYVSSHDIDKAREAAAALEAAGHVVLSTWHLGDGPMRRSAEMTHDEMRDKAKANLHQVNAADVLFLVAADDKVPGGKFVEAGAALGAGKRVVIWGRRENILLHHPKADAWTDLAGAVAAVGG